MRYKGNLCDGCKNELLANEDIVVCPECATPQHRHCYDKNGKCVNDHLHGTDFVWQGTVSENTSVESSTLVNQTAEKGEELICPNCQHSNPKGSEVCRNCGMKFTMFGINVVESLNEQQKAENNKTAGTDREIPEYNAPFQVGVGEGFENNTDSENFAEKNAHESAQTSDDYFGNDSNIFKGPYPAEDYTCGVKTNTIGAFIRNNAQAYISKFKMSDIKGKNSFNWAAFFFAPYWFFYRRLYKPGIIMITIQLCMSIITAPVTNKFVDAYNSFVASDLEAMSDAAFMEAITNLQNLMTPVMIVAAITFVMHIVSGFIANGLYKRYILKNINLTMSFASVREKISHFAKYGGASMIAVLVAYIAQTGLSYLAGYLMY